MKNALIFVFLLYFMALSFGQKKTPEHYSYPFSMEYEPLKVRINIVHLKRTDGSGSYNLNIQDEKDAFNGFLKTAQQSYVKLNPLIDNIEKCYSGTDFYADTKIRIEYNIIEIENNYAWNYLNSGSNIQEGKLIGVSPSEKWYLKSLNDSISNAKNIPKGINVYFTEDGQIFDEVVNTKAKDIEVKTVAASQLPDDKNLKRSSQVHVPNRYLKFIVHKYHAPVFYNTTWEETIKWHTSEGVSLAHELGHSFGLGHSNEFHKANKCPHSLMHQSNANSTKDYLPPPEIKKMHWNLTRTNLMQFVTEDSHYGVTWEIVNDTIWDKTRRFYNNFEIAKDVTLTISDSIILPPQSFIKLNKNSKIIFKGNGKIVDAFGKDYKNFEKHKTAVIFKE